MNALVQVSNVAGQLEKGVARASGLTRIVTRATRARPLLALGVAAGIGLLAGALVSARVGRMAFSTASRHIARELLRQIF